MIVLGTITLWLSAVFAGWSVLAGIAAARTRDEALRESSWRGVIVQVVLLAVTITGLIVSLVRDDFSISFVVGHSSRNLNPFYTPAALLAGWNGAMLVGLLAFVLLGLAGLTRGEESSGQVIAMSVILLLGSVIVLAGGNPFERMPVTPLEGRGLDPRLRDTASLLASPLRVAGFAALGVAALQEVSFSPAGSLRQPDPSRLARWLIVSTMLLVATLGLAVWHAYRTTDNNGLPDWGTIQQVTAWACAASAIALFGAMAGRARKRNAGLGRMGRWSVMVAAGGAVAVGIGLAGWRWGPVREVQLLPGKTATVASPLGGAYNLTHMGVSRFEMTDRIVVAASLDVDRNESPAGLITSERRQHFDIMGAPVGLSVAIAGVRHGLLEDVRVLFLETTGAEESSYRIEISPLMSLVWAGMLLLLLAGVLLFIEVSE